MSYCCARIAAGFWGVIMIIAKIAPAIVAALFCMTAAANAETQNAKAKSGVATIVGVFVIYSRETCQAQAVGDARVRQQPRHGRIEIQRVRGRLTEGLCKGEMAEGLRFVYTSTRGFRGTDETSVDIPWSQWVDGPGAVVNTTTYQITVE